MYVKLDRDQCGHFISKCERCLGKFLRNPEGYERQCFEEVIDDGKETLTLDVLSSGVRRIFVLDDEQRNLLAVEGWATVDALWNGSADVPLDYEFDPLSN